MLVEAAYRDHALSDGVVGPHHVAIDREDARRFLAALECGIESRYGEPPTPPAEPQPRSIADFIVNGVPSPRRAAERRATPQRRRAPKRRPTAKLFLLSCDLVIGVDGDLYPELHKRAVRAVQIFNEGDIALGIAPIAGLEEASVRITSVIHKVSPTTGLSRTDLLMRGWSE